MTQTSTQKDPRYNVDTHFKFGENWSRFAADLSEEEILQAEKSLLNLVPAEALQGKTWLDIGCGSGLHSLCALRNGASHATCIDIDPDSVRTTAKVLQENWDGTNFEAFECNILKEPEFTPLQSKQFDIVYSWGVLHHTGDMWAAINNAASLVGPGGLFVIALYRKTRFCSFWAKEKKLYIGLPTFAKRILDYMYVGALCTIRLLKGENPLTYIREYKKRRGMDFMTDVRDWVGGYPYESATLEKTKAFLENRGFTLLKTSNMLEQSGLLGTGCGEYVFKKMSATEA